MMSMRSRLFSLPFAGFLSVVALTACDLSPTALDSLDSAGLDRLIRTSARDSAQARIFRDLIGPIVQNGDGTLPQLDSLFSLALASQTSVDAGRAERDRAQYRALLDDGWSAIARRETTQGERSLASARRFQAETVVRIFGARTAAVLTSLLERNLQIAIRRLEDGPADERTARLEDMAATVRELGMDARRALAGGDAAASVDIATHAAGLANTLARQLAGR